MLPPLYHEALSGDLKQRLITQILRCVPYLAGTPDRERTQCTIEVVELPEKTPPAVDAEISVAAFSVDTAVEEHGPHLPLATDTIQSYYVLEELEPADPDGFAVAPPVEYGQLTWGLPFGVSVDITAQLTTEYVCGYAKAISVWLNPKALYVVDVHGSIVHRTAIQQGLTDSGLRHSFRWLHEPLVEFAGERGDQHAGGVETALVELASFDLVDRTWWPGRREEIAKGEMDFETAVRLTPDLQTFVSHVLKNPEWNGIVGRINNYFDVDADLMAKRMLDVARRDVASLLEQC